MKRHAGKAFHYRLLLQGVCALALAACSSIPRPTEQVESARAAVAQARPVVQQQGASELGLAQAKLARAEAALQSRDYVTARILAEQAEVDARYAWTLAEASRLQAAAGGGTQ